MNKFSIPLLAAAGLLASPLVAAVECTVSQAVAPAFYDVKQLSTMPTLANGSISVTCDLAMNPGHSPNAGPNVNVTVRVAPGASNNFAARRAMDGPAYNFYVDDARTQVLGDGTNGTTAPILVFDFLSGTTTVQTKSVPIYGKVFANANVRPAVFSDLLAISLLY